MEDIGLDLIAIESEVLTLVTRIEDAVSALPAGAPGDQAKSLRRAIEAARAAADAIADAAEAA